MKYLLSLAALCLAQLSIAQKDVYLNINHLISGNTLNLNQTYTTTGGDNFQVTRLEYYISDIILHHDNGQTTAVNKYLLVNASSTTSELLGSFNLTTLDSISFGIGVDSAYNHLDPSTYATTHPLAHQNPSMHWGWTSGYRFIAYEGKVGNNMTDNFQVHSLGDQNYKITGVATNGILDGNKLNINIKTDYEKALNNINVASGVISHGTTGAAKTLIDNFNTVVFSKQQFNTSTTILENTTIAVLPNPGTVNQDFTISHPTIAEPCQINVYSNLGTLIYSKQTDRSSFTKLSLPVAGLYYIQLLQNNKLLTTKKLVINAN